LLWIYPNSVCHAFVKSLRTTGSKLPSLAPLSRLASARGAASALDFTFSFSGEGSVTGLIQGLVDNTNDQSYGFTATIISASIVPTFGWPVFANVDFGGINVSGGLVTSSAISFTDPISFSSLQLYTAATSSLFDFYNGQFGDNLVFSPVSPPPRQLLLAPCPSSVPLQLSAGAVAYAAAAAPPPEARSAACCRSLTSPEGGALLISQEKRIPGRSLHPTQRTASPYSANLRSVVNKRRPSL